MGTGRLLARELRADHLVEDGAEERADVRDPVRVAVEVAVENGAGLLAANRTMVMDVAWEISSETEHSPS